MDLGYIVMFLGMSILSSMSCKNSAMELIEKGGGYSPQYPKRYIAPAKWIRSLFKIKYQFILRYLYFKLILSLFFAVLGPINLIICIIVDWDPSVVGTLVMIHTCLILLEGIFFVITTLIYRAKK